MSCERLAGVGGIGVIAPLVLYIGSRCKWVFSCIISRLSSRERFAALFELEVSLASERL